MPSGCYTSTKRAPDKDKETLEACNADNLIDVASYLESHNLNLAVDLNRFEIYRVNYDKYFRKIAATKERQGHAYVLKPNHSSNTNS